MPIALASWRGSFDGIEASRNPAEGPERFSYASLLRELRNHQFERALANAELRGMAGQQRKGTSEARRPSDDDTRARQQMAQS